MVEVLLLQPSKQRIIGYRREMGMARSTPLTAPPASRRGHYFTSHEFINSFAIIPICPDLGLDVPHGRDAFPDKTPGLYNKA